MVQTAKDYRELVQTRRDRERVHYRKWNMPRFGTRFVLVRLERRICLSSGFRAICPQLLQVAAGGEAPGGKSVGQAQHGQEGVVGVGGLLDVGHVPTGSVHEVGQPLGRCPGFASLPAAPLAALRA